MNIPKLDIKERKDIHTLIEDIKEKRPKIVSFDTETDGRNIKHNRPFLLSFAFFSRDLKEIYSYTLDFEKTSQQIQIDTLYVFDRLLDTAREVIAHNATFDLHMMDNYGHPIDCFDKLTDSQIYIRLAHDALVPEEGGPPMDLKGYVTRYIDSNARNFQQKLKIEIKTKKRKATADLKAKLRDYPVPEKFKVSGKEKQWTMAMLNAFFKDSVNEIEDLPPKVAEVVREWQKETPNPENYRLLNRDDVTEYAHYDVVYVLLIWKKLHPIIKRRKQQEAFMTEQRLIKALYTLEKTGMYFDLEYAYSAKEKTKEYIKDRRQKFKELLEEDITVNQHEKFKKVIYKKFDVHMSSSDETTIKKALSMNNIPEKLHKIFKLVLELRTLEKWYSTYILRWIKEAEKHGPVLYPQYNATGTITGRISSDFQQFPRNSIKDEDGKELFHPRRMFIVPKDYDMFFLDYAAMEMRLLAIYTMLVGDGDTNLCRVFIPFKCHERDGKWYLDEDLKTEWHPLDPHGLTTKEAFEIDEDHPQFSNKRYYGKRANFAIIYGATDKAIAKALNLDNKTGRDLYEGFFRAFPKVREYIQYVQTHIQKYGYAENLFGRKYYNINAHKARNYLIQGSGADYTKQLLPELVDFLKDYKSKIQGYLHDEFSFLIHKSETHIVPILRTLMEQLETDIRLKVDIEYTDTNWRDKHVWPDA